MTILNCNDISFYFGVTKILNKVSFNINAGEKVGLVGVNGAGKSTLFKVLAGILEPDSGSIFVSKGLKLGYLEQNTGLDSSLTIWDELIKPFSALLEMEDRIKVLEERISSEKDDNKLSSLVKEYTSLTENYKDSGGYIYRSRIKGTLKGLGFSDDALDATINILSGGQKTRIALAKLLLEEPDVLMLDEPTNHLDINAIEWLEEYLKSYNKSVLIISHDRYFLDMVTTCTIELENCECKFYRGNYSQYIKQKQIDREIQEKHYVQQQKEIDRLEAFIEQQRRWNREKNIVAAESRQKAIDRMDKLEKPKNLPDKIKIKFGSSITSGNDVLLVENLSKEYPGNPLFKDINFQIKKNERVFILGPNGCGKSTMLKILAGKIDKSSGDFEYGHNVIMSYYDQEQEYLNESGTIIDEVWDSNEKLTHTEIRNTLASFLFKGEDVFKTISTLSGGEKSRVSIVKLMLSGANLFLMDEPTNHLDINSREVLEQSLMNYDGTLLVVSHDRYFINKLATRILEFEPNSMFDYSGDYSGYLNYKNRSKKADPSSAVESKMTSSKLERMAAKEEQAKLRRLERQIKEAELEIEKSESRLNYIAEEMCLDSVASDHIKLSELHEEQTSLQNRLEELYTLWENLESEKQDMNTAQEG